MRLPSLRTFLLVLAASSASAQSGGGDQNAFGLSYRMGFNISARFKNLGGYAALTPTTNPNRTLDNDPFNYDNGYIYPDSSGQPPGYTRYYGYLAGTPQRPADAPTD